MRTDRSNFLSIDFDHLTFGDAIARMRAVMPGTPFGYVVTPNVDHIVRLHQEPSLREAYRTASLCVCDSQILRLLARFSRVRLELVRGSDLSSAVLEKVVEDGDTVAVIGSSADSVAQLRKIYPGVTFLHHEPPMNLRANLAARAAAADFIASSKARFSLLAVGSPQQEMIAHAALLRGDCHGFALCIGAGLDFVTGKQRRAPRLLQSAGLEWAHRLASNPRRLWKRYLVDGVRILPIYMRWVIS